MSRPLLIAVALACLAACARTSPDASPRSGEPEPAPAAAAPAPSPAGAAEPAVLVELFTSQGCSSCPPADRLLTELVRDPGVIALAFHVDYWNYIGWADPLSSAAWSERQRRYADVLPDARVYTPQLVVQGQGHAVGSKRRDIERLIQSARARAVPGPAVSVEGQRQSPTIAITASPAGGDRPAQLWLAAYQNGIATDVKRGENAGRALRNDYAVRYLSRVPQPGADGAIRVKLPADVAASATGIVVFAQDPATLHVAGATRVELR